MGVLNPREVKAITPALLRHLIGPAEMTRKEISDVAATVAREVVGAPGNNPTKRRKIEEAQAVVTFLLTEAMEP